MNAERAPSVDEITARQREEDARLRRIAPAPAAMPTENEALTLLTTVGLLLGTTQSFFVACLSLARRNFKRGRKRELKNRLAASYHKTPPGSSDPTGQCALEELVLRLVFEVLICRVCIACFEGEQPKSWFRVHRRNWGHQYRIVKLIRAIKSDVNTHNAAKACEWLRFETVTADVV